ncbi:MAG: hypothetical protein ACFE88_16895 [Candidatus Hermodarchaeota archaeon]
MTQICEKIIIELELEENDQNIAQKAEEREHDIWGINPRYHEEIMSLKQAKHKLWAKFGPF